MNRFIGEVGNNFRGIGGVANAAFAGFDYYQGKQEGEDDIRALAGAGGSTAGAAIGATLGSMALPVVGTLAGGVVGSLTGGWLADRGDELIRGNRYQDRYLSNLYPIDDLSRGSTASVNHLNKWLGQI